MEPKVDSGNEGAVRRVLPNTRLFWPSLLFGWLCLFPGAAAGADSVTMTVRGYYDPWLAGMPAGSGASCDSQTHTLCDRAPEQSPVLVEGLSFA
jgi:hypothetical protein